MHNAPPVAFPVGRFVWGWAGGVGAALLSAGGLLGWQVWGQASNELALWAWSFWALCLAWAAAWAPRQQLVGGRLFWSGEAWFWQTEGSSGQGDLQSVSVSVGLDVGSGLLLWIRRQDDAGQQNPTQGPLTCAWVQAHTMPSKWHGFRCAVYSRPQMLRSFDGARHDRI